MIASFPSGWSTTEFFGGAAGKIDRDVVGARHREISEGAAATGVVAEVPAAFFRHDHRGEACDGPRLTCV